MYGTFEEYTDACTFFYRRNRYHNGCTKYLLRSEQLQRELLNDIFLKKYTVHLFLVRRTVKETKEIHIRIGRTCNEKGDKNKSTIVRYSV